VRFNTFRLRQTAPQTASGGLEELEEREIAKM